MKVILCQDVENLGGKGDLKQVKPGYARNYLIPRGLAVVADKSSLKAAEEMKRVEERKERRVEEKLQGMADRIGRTTIELVARAGEEGRIYGSVTAAQISEALKEKLGMEVDKRRVLLDSPIKNIGEHTVNVRLSPGRTITIKVVVTPDQEFIPPAPAPPPAPEPAPEPEAASEEIADDQ